MSRSEIEYLHHIRDEARYLVEASREVSWEEFVADETLKRAFVRSIEVIGEATRTSPSRSAIGIRRSSGEPWPGCATG